jgi:outer membrane lipoprotein-sorting protein
MMLTATVPTSTRADQSPQSETPVVAGVDSLVGSAKLNAILDRVAKQQKGLKTLRGDFIQTKKSHLLLAEEETKGVFFYRAPDAVRWDYAAPDLMTVLIVKNVVVTTNPDLGSVSTTKISKRQRRFVSMLVGAEALDELRGQFRAVLEDPGGSSPYRVVLQPSGGRLKNRVARIEFRIDREKFLPVVMEYYETNGDSMTFELHNVDVDPIIGDEVFEIEVSGSREGESAITSPVRPDRAGR